VEIDMTSDAQILAPPAEAGERADIYTLPWPENKVRNATKAVLVRTPEGD
jgi:hypothetical protein